MLALDRVTVRLGGRNVLREVSLQVPPGELVALVGPNGAGKSTALGVLAGDLRPTQGAARLDGQPLPALSPVALAQRRAVLPQQGGLLFDFTVAEVVALGRAPHAGRSTARQDAAVVRTALATTGLNGFAARRYTGLSGGERARVHFARVLAQLWDAEGPCYLLLDEPTAALDLAHQQQALALAGAWARNGFGVLAVLHDLSLAAQHADRMVLLCDGTVLAEGHPTEVVTPANIDRAYGIEAVVNPHPEEGHPVVMPRAPQIDISRAIPTS
jgi:iron complex transport system ATP-binding protein